MSNQIWLDQYKSLLNLTKKKTPSENLLFSVKCIGEMKKMT